MEMWERHFICENRCQNGYLIIKKLWKGRQDLPSWHGKRSVKIRRFYFFFLGSAFFSGFFAIGKPPPIPTGTGDFDSFVVYKYFLTPRLQLSVLIYYLSRIKLIRR
jgi:hypothetical protein